MTLLALELIAIRTNQEGVPEVLLNTLTLVSFISFNLIEAIAFKI